MRPNWSKLASLAQKNLTLSLFSVLWVWALLSRFILSRTYWDKTVVKSTKKKSLQVFRTDLNVEGGHESRSVKHEMKVIITSDGGVRLLSPEYNGGLSNKKVTLRGIQNWSKHKMWAWVKVNEAWKVDHSHILMAGCSCFYLDKIVVYATRMKPPEMV